MPLPLKKMRRSYSPSKQVKFMASSCDRPSGSVPPRAAEPSTSAEDANSASLILTMTTSNFCCKMLQGLRELRHQESLCDYCLIAEGISISVHKAVLAACSDYFKVMLTGDMLESRQSSVELKGVTATGLKVVVDFAYSGLLELNEDNIHDVLSAATHLQMSDAVELCSLYLKATVTIDNCVDIFNLAELYSLTSTLAMARDYILEHFETVADYDQYYKLTHTQLASMLAENSLRAVSEYRLFELVLRWIHHDSTMREAHLAELMPHIRLPLLSGEELVEKVSKVEMMRRNKVCNDLLTSAKDYHIVVSKQPLLQNARTQLRSDRLSLVLCHGQNLENFSLKTKMQGFLRDSIAPLYNPCLAVVDNFMYACGGKYDSTENNEIATARCFRYDPRFDTWFELASMNEARKDFVMVALDGYLYAIAGQDENMVMCTVEAFSITRNEWEMRTSLTHSVYGHAGAMCRDMIYISGGQRFCGCCANLVRYDPRADVWEEMAPMTHARCNHVMLEVHNKLYVIGGNIEDSYGFPVPIIAIETYNPLFNQWTLCKQTLNIREAGACAVNGQIYIVGGINGEHYYSDIVQQYEPEQDEMQVLEKFPTRIYGKACCILTLPREI